LLLAIPPSFSEVIPFDGKKLTVTVAGHTYSVSEGVQADFAKGVIVSITNREAVKVLHVSHFRNFKCEALK